MKDYKKILEGIVKIISTTEKSDIGFVNICDYISEYCPELRESEDEEIRKTLIRVLNENVGNGIEKYGAKLEDALAWLEKQGVQPRYSIGDVLCDKSCTTLNKDAQHNFEITDIRNGVYICDKCSFPISQQDEYELVAKKIEQKPAKWSEEDENNLYLTTVAIEREYSGELFLAPKKVNEQVGIGRKLINWLRSFENRVGCEVNCTTTKEWSEEDEKRIKNILSVLNVQVCWDGATGKKGNPYQKEINWLKSLKDRYTWKPSEEQLEALKNAIHIKPFENPSDSLLWGLYEQIKKLKEKLPK